MTDYIDSLERLAGLVQKGILSKEEFEAEKARLLSRGSKVEDIDEKTNRGIFDVDRKTALAFGSLAIVFGAILGFVILSDTRDKTFPKETAKAEERLDMVDDPLIASIGFSNLGSCIPNGDFVRLLGRLRSGVDGDIISLRAAGKDVRVRIFANESEQEGFVSQVRAIPISLNWLGLRVSELRTIDWEDGSIVAVSLADNIEKTKSALRAAGIVDLATGKISTDGSSIRVLEKTANPGGSIFSCAQFKQEGVNETGTSP